MLGSLAKCSQGWPGIVTGYKEVTYSDGEKAMAWVGFHVSEARMGEPWSSRKPQLMAEKGQWGVFTINSIDALAHMYKEHSRPQPNQTPRQEGPMSNNNNLITKRVIRVIVYEGDPRWIEKHLAQCHLQTVGFEWKVSGNAGTEGGGGSITLTHQGSEEELVEAFKKEYGDG
jgi:hypothetical protein